MSGRVAGKKMVTAVVAVDQAGSGRLLAWVNVGVVSLVLLSSFAVIHSTHTCRELYTRLQALEAQQWRLQEDYGRLLLEESTWASHYRIEKVARGELGMAEPDLGQYRVVHR